MEPLLFLGALGKEQEASSVRRPLASVFFVECPPPVAGHYTKNTPRRPPQPVGRRTLVIMRTPEALSIIAKAKDHNQS